MQSMWAGHAAAAAEGATAQMQQIEEEAHMHASTVSQGFMYVCASCP